MIVLAALVGATAAAILVGYSAAASQGLLGKEAQSKYLSQLGAAGVVLGGRTEILGSSQAIIDVSLSWATGHGPRTHDTGS